jgi:hypothetical protein
VHSPCGTRPAGVQNVLDELGSSVHYVCTQPSCGIGATISAIYDLLPLMPILKRQNRVFCCPEVCPATRSAEHFTPCHAYKKSSILLVSSVSLMVLNAFFPKSLRTTTITTSRSYLLYCTQPLNPLYQVVELHRVPCSAVCKLANLRGQCLLHYNRLGCKPTRRILSLVYRYLPGIYTAMTNPGHRIFDSAYFLTQCKVSCCPATGKLGRTPKAIILTWVVLRGS